MPGSSAQVPEPIVLERAWAAVADSARAARLTVILATERMTDPGPQPTACVINADGSMAGWQDEGQFDPSEETTYPAFGSERYVFRAGPLTLGVVTCHEGWR